MTFPYEPDPEALLINAARWAEEDAVDHPEEGDEPEQDILEDEAPATEDATASTDDETKDED